MVTDGKAQLTQEYSIGGLPIRVPLIDIHTIGAGGGSMIWADDGGMLPSRSSIRRCRSGAGLLWPGRPGANTHRCPCYSQHGSA